MSSQQESQTQDSAAPAVEPQSKATASAAPAPTKGEVSLAKFSSCLPEIVKAADYGEMWGVDLAAEAPAKHVPTTVVLQKFLRANNGDTAPAAKQLTDALKWRKEMDIVNLVKREFDEKKFGGLGYVTVHSDADGKETVITWNVYGVVKDNKATFGDAQEFIQWRAALMEIGVQKLKLNEVTEPIPEDGKDPYQMVQVHDYLSVSFFRMDPHVKAASQKTISVFSMAYPELLAHKYFVNVPTIMGWMYAAMKLILSPATLKKFHPMRDGTSLANELKTIAANLPKEYGGNGASVKEGTTVGMTVKQDVVSVTSEESSVAAVNEAKTDDAKPAAEDQKVVEVPIVEAPATAATVEPKKEDEKPADPVKEVEEKLAETQIADGGQPSETEKVKLEEAPKSAETKDKPSEVENKE